MYKALLPHCFKAGNETGPIVSQHFSKFLQRPVARARTVPTNDWFTWLTLLQPKVTKMLYVSKHDSTDDVEKLYWY